MMRTRRRTVLMAADAFLIAAPYLASMFLRFGMLWPTYSKAEYALSSVVLAGLLVGAMYLAGVYEVSRPAPDASAKRSGAAHVDAPVRSGLHPVALNWSR
jgi:hypothetical protein